MSEAVFVDCSNLNTLFKVNGRFCLGANYAGNLAQLALDANAVGTSYDVFLSLFPRPKGEGDITIKELSSAQIPFVALRAELQAIANWVDSLANVDNVYICNALFNFVVPSKVDRFKSVFACGDRFAFIEVNNKLVDSMTMYKSSHEFFDEKGSDFVCYGDIDLIDVDSVKSQYPELGRLSKQDIVPLVPLLVSMNSPYKVDLKDIRDSIEREQDATEKEPEETKEEVTVEEKPLLEPDKGKRDVKLEKAVKASPATHKKPSAILLLSIVLCCVLGVLLGIGYQMRDLTGEIATYQQSGEAFETKKSVYERATRAYSTTLSIADGAKRVWSRAAKNEYGVVPSSIEGTPEYLQLSFSCTDVSARDQFLGYMRNKFTVLDMVEVGTSASADGGTVYQYYIKLVP